uniref:Uncharacterized protein n=1 Tax=Amorphochlora amoebiformis TaxID=1561963 RepID=A0A0H5BKV5_9EUKA|nr:hypothetical protein [Amorphochlora amoebiformis]
MYNRVSKDILPFLGGMMVRNKLKMSFIVTRLNDKTSSLNVKPYNINRESIMKKCNEASVHISHLLNKIPNVTEFKKREDSYNIIQRKFASSYHWVKWRIQRHLSPQRNE